MCNINPMIFIATALIEATIQAGNSVTLERMMI